MIRSTFTRRFATLAAIAVAMTVLVPVAQADYGRDRVADSVDTARAAQQRTQSELSVQSGYGRDRVADSVDTARAAQQRDADTALLARLRDLTPAYGMFVAGKSLTESAVEPSQPKSDTGGFDWHVFSLGAGTGVALMLLLGAFGAGVTRRAREPVRTA
jgi:hypothetical protein